ncbi:MAG TPA: hypothetical protein VHZ09_16090 [Acidobacteriaceae bacterium]|jgi:hypothetical protein|nr:hypothetical protein [Acidobacteriaceae bacterium]
MTSFAKFSIVFAFAGLAAVTSGSAESGKKTTTAIASQPNASCPVGVRAQHASGLTAQVPVGKNGVQKNGGQRNSAVDRGPRQKLQLTLNNAGLGAISGVRITVHGWNGTGRTLPTVDAGANYASAAKTMDLTVSVGPRETAEINAWVRGLTAVDSIDLDEVSYADGSSWKSPRPGACSTVPDPVTLISER